MTGSIHGKAFMSDASILRQKAEAILEQRESQSDAKISEIEVTQIIHDLKIRQIELELINEEFVVQFEKKEKHAADLVLAKQALRNSIALTESIFDSVHNGILVVSLEGKIIKVNSKFLEMWRIPNELLNSGDDKTLLDYVLIQLIDPDSFIAKVKELYKKSEAENFDILYFRDGRIFERISRPFFIGGEPKGRVWSFLDISEQRKTYEEKLIADKRLQTLSTAINQSPVIIVITDLMGNIESVNSRFTEVTGYLPEEVIGKNSNILKSGDKTADQYSELWKTLSSGGNWHGIFHNKKKNGDLYWESAIISPVKGNNGRITHYLAVKTDITETKRIEFALHESENRYRILIETAREGIFVAQDGIFKFVNPIMLEIFGYSMDEIVTIPFIDFVHPEDKERITNNHFKRLRGEPVESRYHFRILKKEGAIKWIELNSVKIDWKGHPATLNLISDVTESKEAELQIKLKNEELQKLNAEKDKFFSIIAHDLRGPLGGFMAMTEMLADENQHFTETDRIELMAVLSQSAKSTFNLLERLLEWSQMNRGLSIFIPQDLNLTDIISECSNLILESARRKSITLNIKVSSEYEVFADKNMLQTIVRNLLSNAIKFTPNGGTVSLTAKPVSNNLTSISIKDSGIGMSDEMHRNLFRFDATTKRSGTNGEQSTGLGLLLCKEFVEKQGGKIHVKSIQFIGSEFTFTIPTARKLLQLSKNRQADLDLNKKINHKKLRILIAEDDEISTKLISTFVKGVSKQLYTVNSGHDAIEKCRLNPNIDLILLDTIMNDIEGYEAARQIRKFNQNVIIIAQTTFASKADREKCLTAGCNEYIEKPFDKGQIIELIKKYF